MLVLNRKIEVFDPFDPPKGIVRKMLREINVLRHFKDYLEDGSRPFFLEDPRLYREKVMNTLAKTTEADILFLVPQITENHLRKMHAVIGYLAVSNVPTLQVNSLCNEWSVGKNKLHHLLDAMERAHLVRTIRKRHDTKINSVGAKLLLHEPAIYRFFRKNEGTRQEAYVATALADAGLKVYAATDETECDFSVNGIRLEAGEKAKRAKGADVIIRDAVDVPTGTIMPMWMLGLGY